ncbi:MAG: hypothetical protein WC488_00240 [Candidatus Micrarchaeia archaeon]
MVGKLLVAAAFCLLLFLALAGCLQTKSPDECGGITESYWGAEKDSCYHEVAIGFAVRGDAGSAVQYCGMITPGSNAFSQSERNTCYANIAEALKNPEICNNIEDTSMVGDWTGAVEAYRAECVQKATPRDYTINFCSTTPLILASLLALFIAARRIK